VKRAVMAGVLVACLTGCGYDVRLADLFLLTRTGPGPKLTILVNDSGTISCNGAKAKPISSAMLIRARVLSDDLATDAGKTLTVPRAPGTVDYYRIRLQQGTVSFPDRAASGRRELAQAELFAAQVAAQTCGLGG
jgi:hypothetical protein